MKRLIFVTVFSLLVQSGCEHEGAISPHDRVVTQPEEFDFGLSGDWQTIPDPKKADASRKTDVLSIGMGDEGVYTVNSEPVGEFNVALRAISCGESSDGAIVDVEVRQKDKVLYRYMALAKRKDDFLYLWWIQSKNLAKLMNDEEYSAVIEHGTFSSTVYAKPDQLIACIRKHSRDLVGAPTVFRSIAR